MKLTKEKSIKGEEDEKMGEKNGGDSGYKCYVKFAFLSITDFPRKTPFLSFFVIMMMMIVMICLSFIFHGW